MNSFLSLLQTIIYALSSGLLYPVMILLIVLTAWILFFAGGFFSEWISRLRLKRNIDLSEHLQSIHAAKSVPEEVLLHLPTAIRNYTAKLRALMSDRDEFFDEKVEVLLQGKEMKLTRELDKIRLVIRLGPSLGLMGTLIPMGTGLAAMGQGDMAQLTSNLIIAFTTTVVGIGLGILAYFFSSVKSRWIKQDIMDMELLTEALVRPKEETGKKAGGKKR